MSLLNEKFTPMLLGEVNKPFDDDEYIYEIKYDGVRSLVFVNNGKVVVKNRYGVDITEMFPEIKVLSKYFKEDVIFDGEIIMFENGNVSFSKLQKRIHLKNKKTIDYLSKTNPVVFVCFDILYDGTLLINLSLEERKKILEKYEDNDIFIKSKYVKKDGKKLFNIVKKMNMEGIVAKKINSKYQINERSEDWIKIKNYQKGEFIVLGYINKENSYVISLLLGERLKGKLKYVGKVSLGKKRSLANKIMNMKNIKPILEIKEKDIVYIKPEIKCEVQYLERTNNGSLRQPFVP